MTTTLEALRAAEKALEAAKWPAKHQSVCGNPNYYGDANTQRNTCEGTPELEQIASAIAIVRAALAEEEEVAEAVAEDAALSHDEVKASLRAAGITEEMIAEGVAKIRVAKGYEPDPCPFCGELKVVRMGTTLKCTTDGCGAYRQWERAVQAAAVQAVVDAALSHVHAVIEARVLDNIFGPAVARSEYEPKLIDAVLTLDAIRAAKAHPSA